MSPLPIGRRRLELYAGLPVMGASAGLLTSLFPAHLPLLYLVDIVPVTLMLAVSLSGREWASSPVSASVLFAVFHAAFWIPVAYGVERLYRWRKGGSKLRLRSRGGVALVIILAAVAVPAGYVPVRHAVHTCWGCPETVVTGYDEATGGIMTESHLLVPALVEEADESLRASVVYGRHDSMADYIRHTCQPGSTARYNVDDGLAPEPGVVLAEIHCLTGNGYVNLNDGLLFSRFAVVSEELCGTSEFGGSWWARAAGADARDPARLLGPACGG